MQKIIPFKHLVILLVLFTLSCTKKNEFSAYYQTENASEFEKKLDLRSIDTLRFPLDEKSSFESNSISYQKNKDQEYLSILNPFDQSIRLYDYSKQEQISTTKMDEEGPNGVGTLGPASAHLFHSTDSIFLYNINLGKLFLVNQESKVINQYLISDYENSANFPAPFPSTLRPMYFFQDNIFMACGINRQLENYEDHPSSLKIDLSSRKLNYLTTYPKIYSSAYWGATYKYDPSLTINSKTSELTVNYPIDPFLHSMNLHTGTQTSKFVGSSYFEEINPYQPDPKFFLSRNPNERDFAQLNQGLSTSDFESIIYDEVRDLYYRISYIRPSMEQVQANDAIPDFSIIVLNNNFEKVGEKLFERELYDCTKIFISQGGINIARSDLYDIDENYLQFELFEIIEI